MTPSSTSSEPNWSDVLLAYQEAADSGATDVREWIHRYPQFAERFQRFVDNQVQARRFLADEGSNAATPTAPGHFSGQAVAMSLPARLGDYELFEEIARGGMGVVYKARQVGLGRTVAVKMILSGPHTASEDLLRFRAEAEASARLDHPNIVPIYEVGEQEGRHFFSMKFIEGRSLRDLSAQHGRLGPRVFVQIMARVARAVHFAHQHGILHRDLKPGNVLMESQDGNLIPYVADFGLAKRLTEDSNLTQSGAIVGTPNYMSPEQASGRKDLTTAADTYSLGAIIYELLTGQKPFQGRSPMETILQVQSEDPERPSAINRDIDRDLETICLKCLEKEPRRRYPSAEALAEDLEHWLAGEPIDARPVSILGRCQRWARRRPGMAASLASLATVAMVAVGLITWQWRVAVHERQRTEDALREAEANLRLARLNDCLQRVQRAAAILRLAHMDKLARIRGILDSVPPELRRWEWHFVNRDAVGQAMGKTSTKSFYFKASWAAFDPSGARLLVLDENGVMDWRDTRDGKLMESPVTTKTALYATFSPDGRFLAAYHKDGAIKLWNLELKELLREIKVPIAARSSLTFDARGSTLAWIGGGKICTWSVAEGQERSWDKEEASFGSFTPMGLLVAGGNCLSVWDAAKGVSNVQIDLPDAMEGAAVCRDGRLFAYVAPDYSIKVWDLGKRSECMVLRGHRDAVRSLSFHPTEPRLASGGEDRELFVWDLETGSEAFAVGFGFQHDPVKQVAFSPNGHVLLAIYKKHNWGDAVTGFNGKPVYDEE